MKRYCTLVVRIPVLIHNNTEDEYMDQVGDAAIAEKAEQIKNYATSLTIEEGIMFDNKKAKFSLE